MRTILAIEDDADVLDNIQDLLQSEGYVVVAATNGTEGLKAARLRQPDLIICDVMMPDLDGYEVLRRLRSEPETMTIPFIFVTAKAGRSDQRAGMDMGADDYLVKPFTANELLRAVHTRLARHEEQHVWYQERIEELRSNLSRTLPHELRTPLSCILGYSQFLMEIYKDVDPEELRSMLEEINTSARRLERLVENYHLYAHLEISVTDPEWRAALFSQGVSYPMGVLSSVAHALAERWGRSGDLVLDLRPAAVSIQEQYLEKIAEELLGNAFKFSEPGTQVCVRGRQEDDYYVITICDEGRGMTAEQIDRVGAFVQFDRHHYEQQGLGLGLTIARRLVELHRGRFELDSRTHEGTTVRLHLPLAIEQRH